MELVHKYILFDNILKTISSLN